MQLQQRLAGVDLRAALDQDHRPDGVIDRLIDPLPAGAEDAARLAEAARLEAVEDAGPVGPDEVALLRVRQAGDVVEDARVAPLTGDDRAELLQAAAGRERLP